MKKKMTKQEATFWNYVVFGCIGLAFLIGGLADGVLWAVIIGAAIELAIVVWLLKAADKKKGRKSLLR